MAYATEIAKCHTNFFTKHGFVTASVTGDTITEEGEIPVIRN